jgi:hypothetical protein
MVLRPEYTPALKSAKELAVCCRAGFGGDSADTYPGCGGRPPRHSASLKENWRVTRSAGYAFPPTSTWGYTK